MHRQSDTSDRVFLVPQGETRCLLASAGILAYGLCDRNYDCENCPLYQALKRRMSPADEVTSPRQDTRRVRVDVAQAAGLDPDRAGEILQLFQPFERLSLRRTLYYGPGHCWVALRGMALCRIGVDDLFATAIPEIDSIVPPEEGRRVESGKPLAWLIIAGEMLPILSPLPARVLRANPKVLSDPTLLRRDPYGDGWIVEAEPERFPEAVRQLRYGEAAVDRLVADAAGLCREIVRALDKGSAGVGLVSQDGGRIVATPAEALGVPKYVAILRRVLCSGN